MNLITLLMVGLAAGFIASLIASDSGYGLLADIALGVAGAVVGGWGFRELHPSAPFETATSDLVLAFIGAVILLVAVRLIKLTMNRAPRV